MKKRPEVPVTKLKTTRSCLAVTAGSLSGDDLFLTDDNDLFRTDDRIVRSTS